MSLFGQFAQKKTRRLAVRRAIARDSRNFAEGMTFAVSAKSAVVIDVMNHIHAFGESPAQLAGTCGAERHQAT